MQGRAKSRGMDVGVKGPPIGYMRLLGLGCWKGTWTEPPSSCVVAVAAAHPRKTSGRLVGKKHSPRKPGREKHSHRKTRGNQFPRKTDGKNNPQDKLSSQEVHRNKTDQRKRTKHTSDLKTMLP